MYKFIITGKNNVVLEYKTVNERVPTSVFVKENDVKGFEVYLKSLKTVNYTIIAPEKIEVKELKKKKAK